MKKNDFLFVSFVLLLFAPFIFSDDLFNGYLTFNKHHGMVTSFIKFGILATLGELIGLRIRTGKYIQKGFGILPKIIIWGFIGLSIKLAFIVFATGVPNFISYLGFKDATAAMQGSLSLEKLGIAFFISVSMNIIYAPVMMTFHKITDIHVSHNRGELKSIFKPIDFAAAFALIDWKIQWHFVFKKTIPLFWIPAHTLTFLMPPEFQVLFAAILSIMLGLILAVAALKSEK